MSEISVEEYYDMWTSRIPVDHQQYSPPHFHYGFNPNPEQPFKEKELAKSTHVSFLINQLGIPQSGQYIVADIGCGVGGTTLGMLEYNPELKIMPFNLISSQLKLMESFGAYKIHQKSIHPIQSDMNITLPLPQDSIDYAIAIESSCYAEDKEAYYREVTRCLKIGGVQVVADIFYNRQPETQEEIALVKQSLTGWLVPNWHIQNPNIEDALVKYTDITANMLPDIKRSAVNAQQKIDDGTCNEVEIGHYQSIVVLYEALQNGTLQYGVLKIAKTK